MSSKNPKEFSYASLQSLDMSSEAEENWVEPLVSTHKSDRSLNWFIFRIKAHTVKAMTEALHKKARSLVIPPLTLFLDLSMTATIYDFENSIIVAKNYCAKLGESTVRIHDCVGQFVQYLQW